MQTLMYHLVDFSFLHSTLGQNFFPAGFQLFLSLMALLIYLPGSALHMRDTVDSYIHCKCGNICGQQNLLLVNERFPFEIQRIVFYIPVMFVLMLDSQCMLHDNQISFSIPYLPPSKTCPFDPSFRRI